MASGTSALAREEGVEACEMSPELRVLFHRLNNQLGIVLAHAELLEAKAAKQADRVRATQVVTSVLDARGTAREIRHRAEAAEAAAGLNRPVSEQNPLIEADAVRFVKNHPIL